MADIIDFAAGGYRFIKGVFQYSAGVAALPGFRLERVRLAEPLPMAAGFRRISEILAAANRPLTALSACELRSPAPFTEGGFLDFNKLYAATLAEWGLLDTGQNPVARSNVCPELAPPVEPSFWAFTYSVPDVDGKPSFVVAGSGEAAEGHANYKDRIVALGDIGRDGLRAKAEFVLDEMERRMGGLGFGWKDTSAVQVYTVHDIYPFLANELGRRGAMRSGVTWHFNRPPVVNLEYEMDCRSVTVERVV